MNIFFYFAMAHFILPRCIISPEVLFSVLWRLARLYCSLESLAVTTGSSLVKCNIPPSGPLMSIASDATVFCVLTHGGNGGLCVDARTHGGLCADARTQQCSVC